MNNVKKSIGWCDFTFNPITGCARNPPCEYCYARRIHERFYDTPFSDIVIHPERLFDKGLDTKRPLKIFVGSMSDVQYWKTEWIESILHLCRQRPQHTFMFLSKDYRSYDGYSWPENTMQGVTIECDREVLPQCQIVNTFLKSQNRRHFFSIEPILGTLKVRIGKRAEIVIVGAMSGPGAIKPKPEWIQSIKRFVPGEKVFWKNNIKKYL